IPGAPAGGQPVPAGGSVTAVFRFRTTGSRRLLFGAPVRSPNLRGDGRGAAGAGRPQPAISREVRKLGSFRHPRRLRIFAGLQQPGRSSALAADSRHAPADRDRHVPSLAPCRAPGDLERHRAGNLALSPFEGDSVPAADRSRTPAGDCAAGPGGGKRVVSSRRDAVGRLLRDGRLGAGSGPRLASGAPRGRTGARYAAGAGTARPCEHAGGHGFLFRFERQGPGHSAPPAALPAPAPGSHESAGFLIRLFTGHAPQRLAAGRGGDGLARPGTALSRSHRGPGLCPGACRGHVLRDIPGGGQPGRGSPAVPAGSADSDGPAVTAKVAPNSALAILVVLHGIVLMAGFLAPYPFADQHRDFPYAPLSRFHFLDTAGHFHLRPFVYGLSPDSRSYPVEFCVGGRLFGVRGPGVLFVLGSDGYGRDLFSRLLCGVLGGGYGVGCPPGGLCSLGRVLSGKERAFVLAARGFGASDAYLIGRHIFPLTRGVVLTQATVLIPQFILAEVTLSFRGLGVGEPIPSWGNMLAEARQYYTVVSHPWMLAPGLAVIPVLFAWLLLADALHR